MDKPKRAAICARSCPIQGKGWESNSLVSEKLSDSGSIDKRSSAADKGIIDIFRTLVINAPIVTNYRVIDCKMLATLTPIPISYFLIHKYFLSQIKNHYNTLILFDKINIRAQDDKINIFIINKLYFNCSVFFVTGKWNTKWHLFLQVDWVLL
jgi:hypothetical protein